MYKLIIEDINGIWRVADLGEDKPAMTYQINNLAELKDRQADYSQEINLPLTPNNIHLLGFSHCPDVVTEIPYKKLNCRLYSNDYELAGIGSVIYIDSVTDESFVCQILSGNANLFDTMTDTTLKDIADTSILGSVVIGQTNVPIWAKILSCCIGKDQNNNNVISTFYFLNLYKVINNLVTYLGYSLISNVTEEEQNNIYFSISTLKPLNPYSLSTFYAKAVGYTSTVMGDSSSGIYVHNNAYDNIPFIITNNTYNILAIQGVRYGNDTPKRLTFTSNITGKIKLFCHLNFDLNQDNNSWTESTGHTYYYFVYFNLEIIKNGETLYTTGDLKNNFNTDLDLEIEVEENDIIDIIARIVIPFDMRTGTANPEHGNYTNYHLNMMSSYIEITELDAEVVPEGGKLFFQNNTGFDNCQDLFKAFLQTFALICKIDNVNKKVYCYSYKQLYDNIHNSKDWSKKTVLNKESTLSFDLTSYGQKNSISMKEKDDYTDKGYFEVANEVLDKNKELFSLAWESGKDISTTINNATTKIAFIPVYEWDDDGVKSFKETTPHLVTVNSTTNIPTHLTAQNIIDTFYVEIKDKLLANAKILEIYLYLTDEDIKDFDAFTPVYIARFGLYFYVNKITNYVNSKLTKVELIKL